MRASILILSSLLITAWAHAAPVIPAPRPTLVPVPHPTFVPGPAPVTSGRLILQWDDQITTNFEVETSTSRNPSNASQLDTLFLVRGAGVRFSISPCQNGNCPIVGPTARSGWGAIGITAHNVGQGGEAAAWVQQFAMCKTAFTSPAYMRDAYKKRTPNWSITVNLDAAHFAPIQKKYNDVLATPEQQVWFDFDVSGIVGLDCDSYALMSSG